MTMQVLTKTIRLSPQEGLFLGQMSREEHVPELTLLKKFILEGMARRRVEWACAAYRRGELSVSSTARYAGLDTYEMLDELKRRGVEIATSEQFLDGLSDLADLFNVPELREAAAEFRAPVNA